MTAELAREVDLCLPSGKLNPAAVGWTRTPVHRANLRTGDPLGRAATWARTRRWDSWTVQTPDYCLVLQVSSLNYAGMHEVWLLDRATGAEHGATATVPLARDVRLPSRYGGGPVRGRSGAVAVAFDPVPEGIRVRAVAPDLRLDLTVEEVRAREALGVVVPWGERLFQYTVRQVALPVRGRISVEGRGVAVDPADRSWAVGGFGRGRWPYSVEWIAGVGSGVVDGVVTGLQLGGLRTEGAGTSENALVLDGRLHHIEEDLSWAYDPADRGATWFVTGERVQVQLRPFHVRTSATRLGVLATATHQSFGTWTGWVVDDAGTRRRVDGLVGWAEDLSSRW